MKFVREDECCKVALIVCPKCLIAISAGPVPLSSGRKKTCKKLLSFHFQQACNTAVATLSTKEPKYFKMWNFLKRSGADREGILDRRWKINKSKVKDLLLWSHLGQSNAVHWCFILLWDTASHWSRFSLCYPTVCMTSVVWAGLQFKWIMVVMI